MNQERIKELHTLAKLNLSDNEVEARTNAFEDILEKSEILFWIDLIKFYLNIKHSKNIDLFISIFQEKDSNFPRTKVDKLAKSLALIALTLKLEKAVEAFEFIEENSEDEDDEEIVLQLENSKADITVGSIVSSALANASFAGQNKIESKVPIIDILQDFTQKYSESERQIPNMTMHTNRIEELKSELADSSLDHNDAIHFLLNSTESLIASYKIQSEEIDILWWIFGGYSEIAEDSFGNISHESMIILAAQELWDRSKFKSEIPSAIHILRKVISLAGKKPKSVTINSCIAQLPDGIRDYILANTSKDDIDSLTPFLNALKTPGSGKNYQYRDVSFESGLLAIQLYKELCFINSL